ncbi:MAG: hypothetical protein H0V70_27700 [Ktedonobacteraceae bacterium]|nr:hypothetical protein [Ktedonobacteraceae bacterium]
MTFLYAAHLAREHGYSSCIFLPADHLLYTVTNNTFALFASCEEIGPVQCIPYIDLRTMNDERLLTALQQSLSPTSTDKSKTQRRVSKKVQS